MAEFNTDQIIEETNAGLAAAYEAGEAVCLRLSGKPRLRIESLEPVAFEPIVEYEAPSLAGDFPLRSLLVARALGQDEEKLYGAVETYDEKLYGFVMKPTLFGTIFREVRSLQAQQDAA